MTTKNQALLTWIDEMAAITKPESIVWIDGSEEQLEALRDDGIDLARLKYDEIRQLRKDLQMIFQDPYSSLNPRMTVGQIISEGMIAHKYFKKNDERMQRRINHLIDEYKSIRAGRANPAKREISNTIAVEKEILFIIFICTKPFLYISTL